MAVNVEWETLAGDTNTNAAPGAGTDRPVARRGRKPRTTGDVAVTKSMIVDALTLANLPIQLSADEYALTDKEIDSLADAWYRVIKQNPHVAKYLVVGQKLGTWGNLLFIHAQIIEKRLKIYNARQDAARSARTHGGPERDRKNDARATPIIFS